MRATTQRALASWRGAAHGFFYCAKAQQEPTATMAPRRCPSVSAEWSATPAANITRRDEGVVPRPRGNHHPTVKPTDLMRYLCRLVTPPGGVVLDRSWAVAAPAAAVLAGFRFIGCELSPEYLAIAQARIAHALTGASYDSPQHRARRPH